MRAELSVNALKLAESLISDVADVKALLTERYSADYVAGMRDAAEMVAGMRKRLESLLADEVPA